MKPNSRNLFMKWLTMDSMQEDSMQEFSCIIREFCRFPGIENPAKGAAPRAGLKS